MKISIIGLGKLGIGTATCFAYVGYDVLGIDINKEIANSVNDGKPPVIEPLLQETMDDALGNLEATTNLKRAIDETDITFIMLPTPSKLDGSFSDYYLGECLTELSMNLRESNKPYHLFVIMSTVIPGTIEESLIPLIEDVTESKLNEGFGVCYNPEFIALGSFIKNFLQPDFVLIGESNKIDGDKLTEIYTRVCGRATKIVRMSIINAEIVKLTLSPFITTKISFVNSLSAICDNVPGADVDVITYTLGLDSRISPKCLKTGMSFGGTCFPRDNPAFEYFAKKYNCESPLARTVSDINKYHTDYIIQRILDYLTRINTKFVSILGLSYKPDTPVIEDSPVIEIIERLLKQGIGILVYDPLAMDNVREYFGDKIRYASSVKECVANNHLVVITTMDRAFKDIDDSYFSKEERVDGNTINILFDCWRMLDPSKFTNNTIYIGLGKYNDF